MNRETVQRWLDAYVRAWQTYDPAEIGALFTEDAVCHYDPFGEPVRGRDAIVASWLEVDRRDPPGTYAGHYQPLAVDGDLAIANGRSRYFEADGTTPKEEYDNIFLLRFAADGRCAEYREWYMRRPKQ
jgi:uncharacterized protein (TIGR02246 family)